MAGTSGLGRVLEKVRAQFVKELDINKLLPRLLVKGVLTVLEEKEVLGPAVPQKRVEVLLDILSRKDRSVFYELCRSLEECAPHLLTVLVVESHQDQDSVVTTKERDALLHENANGNTAQKNLEQSLKDIKDIDQASTSTDSLPEKENVLNASLSPHTTRLKVRDKLLSVETDQVYEENGPNVTWETHYVSLQKVPTFGFGIAVSGGYDSPHFANGDPSVAISDVIRGGPAEGKLLINDRIVTVNGISLENVDHNMAIRVLRESGSIISLVVRRRFMLPSSGAKMSNASSKITLTKKSKTDEFGLILGYKVFIREIVRNSLASRETTLHEGDTVLKINDTPLDNLSLVEVNKLMDRSKEKLQLVVTTEGSTQVVNTDDVSAPENMNNAAVVPAQLRDSDNVNIFRPNRRSEEDIYVKDPTSRLRRAVPNGAYPRSENTRYDGRYVWDNDPPSWATLPRKTERKMSKKSDDKDSIQLDQNDGSYSDQDDGSQSQGDFVPIHKPGNFVANQVFLSRSFNDMTRTVTFHKDRQTGLGLRLAGGNATGMFIASVHPGSSAEREGLMEGDKILFANDIDLTGMIREEAVSYLTNLEGQVSLVVQYRKEEYIRIMASHEAGDSFYIRAHFKHAATDPETEHSIKIGDIFHVKDTLFRGIGGSWLVVKITDGLKQKRKGTIPNSKIAEIIKSQQSEEGGKENFPRRGRGSFFRRKSFSRRSKSLGKDHWEQIIFSGVGTKFPAYERVVYREPGFTRPVVLFGAISDVARERLLLEFPDRFDSPQADKTSNQGEKNVVVTLGSIRDAVTSRKHCLLDIAPFSVDRLNYAQYNPIVVFLKADTKQEVKDVRARWNTPGRSHRKLMEQSEKIEKTHSHVFTGYLKHTGTDAWFPKLYEIIESQQRQKIWMSETQPVEDMSNDLMFPMSSRMSCTTVASSNADITQLQSSLDISTLGMQQGGKFSSVPSVNIGDNLSSYSTPPPYKNQRKTSHDLMNSVSDISYVSARDGDSPEFNPYKEKKEEEDKPSVCTGKQDTSICSGSQLKEPHGQGAEDAGYTDNTSQLSDSYSKCVNSPQNKHDDTKLQEKFGILQNTGREKSPGYDAYRYARSTAVQAGGQMDPTKVADVSSRYRTHNSTTSGRYRTPTVVNTIPSSYPTGLGPVPQAASSPYLSSGQNKAQFHTLDRGPSLDCSATSRRPDQDLQQDTKSYANKVYMNQFDLQKARQAKLQPEAALGVAEYPPQLGHVRRERAREGMQGRIPTLDRQYSRPR